jgi:hypothetical protein
MAAADPYAQFQDATGDPFAQFSDAVTAAPPASPPAGNGQQQPSRSVWARGLDTASIVSPVGGAIVSSLTNAASNLGATGSIVHQLAAGNVHSLGDASRVAERYKAANPPYTPPAGSVSHAITQGMSSDWNPLNWPGVALDKAGEGLSSLLENVTDSKGNRLIPSSVTTAVGPIVSGAAKTGLMTLGTAKGLLARAPAKTVPAAAALETPDGAPSAAPPASSFAEQTGEPVGDVSPNVKAVRDQVAPTLGPINQEALTRHLEDKSLPFPAQLTEGQATQNPALISDELNGRATPEGQPIAERLNAQNAALVKNLNAIRDQAAPDSGLNPTPVHAQTLMDAYEAKDAAANTDISAKYQKLTDANGGDFPVNGKDLVTNIDAALKQKLKSGYVPPGLQSALQEFRDGRPMNFEDFETLRSDAADAMRNGSGSEKAAAGIIRQELEKLPLTGDAAKLKPLADEARKAAAARFAAINADPAYKAVVDGTAKSSTFADKYVLNAAREHLQALQDNIGDQPPVRQALGGITTNQLRARANIDAQGNGNFAQSGYNKTLERLRPNLDLLVDQPTANHLNTLGNVARYTQFQPKGNWVNSSNTAVTAQGLLTNKMAGVAEHGANYLAGGVPVGSAVRFVTKTMGASKAAAARQAATTKALAPFAGSGAPASLWDSIPGR